MPMLILCVLYLFLGLICTVGIDAVRAMMLFGCWRCECDMVFCPKTFIYIEILAPWDEDVVILTLPWRRRLSPVATCCRLGIGRLFCLPV